MEQERQEGQITSVEVDQAERRADAEPLPEDPQGNLWAALSLGLIFAAAAIWAAEVTGIALFDEGAEAAITAKLEAEAAARKALPCPITVRQFGPGEKWATHHHVYECARAAITVPANVLTYPLAAK